MYTCPLLRKPTFKLPYETEEQLGPHSIKLRFPDPLCLVTPTMRDARPLWEATIVNGFGVLSTPQFGLPLPPVRARAYPLHPTPTPQTVNLTPLPLRQIL